MFIILLLKNKITFFNKTAPLTEDLTVWGIERRTSSLGREYGIPGGRKASSLDENGEFAFENYYHTQIIFIGMNNFLACISSIQHSKGSSRVLAIFDFMK